MVSYWIISGLFLVGFGLGLWLRAPAIATASVATMLIVLAASFGSGTGFVSAALSTLAALTSLQTGFLFGASLSEH